MKCKLVLLILLVSLAAALSSCGSADSKNPAPSPEEEQSISGGQTISFETTDLDGNSVRSDDLFQESRLTMVNIWGTYCGPCIGEMPELELLHSRLGDKDCSVIGIVCDVAGPLDTKQLESAREIVRETGVTYRNLLPWNGFNRVLPAQYIPTTFFIDQEGHIVGEPVIGARGADEYEALVDDALSQIGR